MFKKSFALLIVLLLGIFGSVSAQDAASTLPVACPEGDATISVAAGAVGVEFDVAQEQAARYMEACPNVTVEILEMPDSSTERLGVYQQFWEAQDPGVDVYQTDVIWAGIIAPHAVDLSEYVDEEFI
ncbi:partial putative ABC transporter-binding protein, partial [uncultured bacterium]